MRYFYRMSVVAWAIVSLMLVAADSPQRIRGKVQRVVDGDTIILRGDDKQKHNIRLAGIDAPESNQPGGKQATKQLRQLVGGKQITVFSEGKDRYGRIIGHLVITDINLLMIRKGYAWHYEQYSDDETLAEAEQFARESNLGIWQAEDVIPPWQYRRQGGVPDGPTDNPPQPGETTVYVTEHGKKYHTKDCRYLSGGGIPVGLKYAKEHYGPCSSCLSPDDPPVE